MLLCDNQKMAENTSELLSENQIPSVILQKENTGDSQKELTVITYGMKIPGYELTVSKFALFHCVRKELRRFPSEFTKAAGQRKNPLRSG